MTAKVVIGEDMENRVIPTAHALGAEYYKPPPLDSSLSADKQLDQAFADNKAWINQKMDQGLQILDCGAAPGRANYPEPTSDFYGMERNEIQSRGYTDYKEVTAQTNETTQALKETTIAPAEVVSSAGQESSSFRDRMEAKREAAQIKKIEPPPEPAPSKGLSK